MDKSRVLIVDDDPVLAEGYARVLQMADYEVATASTGREGLSRAAAEHPDLLLLDVRLPDISGIEVCRRVKADPALSRIQVILVTGVSTSPDDQASGIEAGADAYLPKPVHLRTLLAHAQTLLQAPHAEARRELALLAQWPRGPEASIAAQSLGLLPLRQSLPPLFEELVQHYGELLDAALEHRLYKVERAVSERLRSMADQLGYMKAGPRDVVQIHHAALERKSTGATVSRARAYLEEGRLVVLELMGYLVGHYRNYALSVRAATGAAGRAQEAGQGSLK